MILITLGTQDKQFSRLLKAVDRQIELGNIKEEVIAQVGCTNYKSTHIKMFDLIPIDEFEGLISKCNILITHGGVGSIINGLRQNKKVIAVPRLKKYKEHTNDHQIQIIENFFNNGYIIDGSDLENLESILKDANTFKPKKYQSNTINMVNMIGSYIDKC